MIKKGDNVRFMNAVGGGKVVRVDEIKKILYVEDADGFEIPVSERECVVVGEVNKETNFPKKDFKTNQAVLTSPINQSTDVVEESIVETPEGETLKVLLAFFPVNIKQLQSTSYECYLVNDSNYFLYYNVITGENNNWKSAANGIIEPNMQELLTEISKDQLSLWEKFRIQLIPFKKGKNYIPQAVIDSNLKINTVKFYKLHSFIENDYFDDLAMLIDVVCEKEKEVEAQKLANISPEEIKKAMFSKEQTGRPRIAKHQQVPEILEIDLHINELLDNTAGLSNAAMLQCQIDKFHEVIAENKNRKGQKIVFIHGKGEGVLRKEIEKLLKTQYKNFYFQDASFREYGFGATLVTIK